MWSIFKKIIFVIAIFLIACFSVLVILSRFSLGGVRLFSVSTGSMAPKIPVGSLVIVKKMADYQIGDIITFISQADSKKTITHRVFSISNQDGIFYTTKGDANNSVDSEPVSKAQVLGKVASYLPLLGYFSEFSRSTWGLILLIIIPATVIIYSEIINIKNELVAIFRKRKTGVP